jgi:hypothetical protein
MKNHQKEKIIIIMTIMNETIAKLKENLGNHKIKIK